VVGADLYPTGPRFLKERRMSTVLCRVIGNEWYPVYTPERLESTEGCDPYRTFEVPEEIVTRWEETSRQFGEAERALFAFTDPIFKQRQKELKHKKNLATKERWREEKKARFETGKEES
jgi:hypothetical protein